MSMVGAEFFLRLVKDPASEPRRTVAVLFRELDGFPVVHIQFTCVPQAPNTCDPPCHQACFCPWCRIPLSLLPRQPWRSGLSALSRLFHTPLFALRVPVPAHVVLECDSLTCVFISLLHVVSLSESIFLRFVFPLCPRSLGTGPSHGSRCPGTVCSAKGCGAQAAALWKARAPREEPCTALRVSPSPQSGLRAMCAGALGGSGDHQARVLLRAGGREARHLRREACPEAVASHTRGLRRSSLRSCAFVRILRLAKNLAEVSE